MNTRPPTEGSEHPRGEDTGPNDPVGEDTGGGERVARKVTSAALLVSAGILLSRIAGLIRAKATAFYLGNGIAADAISFAVRIPNLLQNLLGEGVLSASFIPVYAELNETDKAEAGRVAGAVFGLLAAVSTGLAVVMVTFAEPIVDVIAGGLSGTSRDLTVILLRIVAPGTAVLVLSAWCLGVLNTHRHFFLSYVSPVLWNAAQIVLLIAGGLAGWRRIGLAEALAWGVVVGGVLQFAVQLPSVRRLEPNLKLSLRHDLPGVRETLRRFGPAVLGRGVVQLSAFVDLALAAQLAVGARSGLDQAQVLYLLPISLFAMSVAAAELPELARSQAKGGGLATGRVVRGLGRIQFFVAFTAMAYLLAGQDIVGAVFQGGSFGTDSTRLVGTILATYALGIPAVAASRMLQNVAYAFGDTKGPARIAGVRVLVAGTIGFGLMFPLDEWAVSTEGMVITDPVEVTAAEDELDLVPDATGSDRDDLLRLGAVGLAAGSAIASWIEFGLLRARVRTHLPELAVGPPLLRPLPSLLPSAGIMLSTGWLTSELHPLISAPLVLGLGGLTYVGVAHTLGAPEARALTRSIRR